MPVQENTLKRPPAQNAELPASQAARGGAAGALAQTLNGSPRVVAHRALAVQLNRGGLPENLRNGVERLSGVSMAGVKVHYNSAKPAQLNAEAYAQGRDIHLAPGKAHHLPHEAWHVAQQAQGRVKPTMQLQESVPVNDDKRLEKEADELGKKAATLGAVVQREVPKNAGLPKPKPKTVGAFNNVGADVPFPIRPPNRTEFGFKEETRPFVLARSHPSYNGGRIESVRVATGTQENVKGVQLDHQYAWARIAANMSARNRHVHDTEFKLSSPKRLKNRKLWYSRKEARRYYNDYTNLQPVLGGDNAAGGIGGVAAAPPIHNDLANSIATTHGSWMQLQRDINRLGAVPAQGIRENVVAHLNDTRTAMAATSTEIEQHLNPQPV